MNGLFIQVKSHTKSRTTKITLDGKNIVETLFRKEYSNNNLASNHWGNQIFGFVFPLSE